MHEGALLKDICIFNLNELLKTHLIQEFNLTSLNRRFQKNQGSKFSQTKLVKKGLNG